MQADDFGHIVHIALDTHDRRIFTPTSHGSPSWHRDYNHRSALERINNHIVNSFFFENHFIRDLAKIKNASRSRISTVRHDVHGVGARQSRPPEQMRSLVHLFAPQIRLAEKMDALQDLRKPIERGLA